MLGLAVVYREEVYAMVFAVVWVIAFATGRVRW
jgi:hypothetical protein